MLVRAHSPIFVGYRVRHRRAAVGDRDRREVAQRIAARAADAVAVEHGEIGAEDAGALFAARAAIREEITGDAEDVVVVAVRLHLAERLSQPAVEARQKRVRADGSLVRGRRLGAVEARRLGGTWEENPAGNETGSHGRRLQHRAHATSTLRLASAATRIAGGARRVTGRRAGLTRPAISLRRAGRVHASWRSTDCHRRGDRDR